MIDKINDKIKWVRSPDALAVLALLFSFLLFFYDLFQRRCLLTERDLGPYFIPPKFFWVESIKRGDFPLWNPHQFSGHPFFANPQHAILYPLNFLFFLLPFDVAFNIFIILHFFLGGLFTYFFLKDLRVGSGGALLSGLTFMLSGYLLSVHSLLTILLSVIWAPLIMMFFRRALLSPGFKNEVLTALFMALSLFGGGIEVVYCHFFVLFFMVLLMRPCSASGVHEEECHRGFWLRVWVGGRSLLIVSGLFLTFSAVQLIPFLELFLNSIRGEGISYYEATIWSFAPKDVLLFFLPDAYGYFADMKKYWVAQCWFKTLYTGGLPFILGAIFFVAGKGRRLFLALMFFSLFLSLGKYNPLYSLVFKYVPFFDGIRYPVKFLTIFMLALSITAGLGFQKVTELAKEAETKRFRNGLIFFALGSGLLLLALLIGHHEVEGFLRAKGIDYPDFNLLTVNFYNLKRFLFYLTLFFLLLRVGHEVKWKGWVKVLLALFLSADLFGNMGFYGIEKTADFSQKTKIQELLSSDQGAFRVFSTEKTISPDSFILIEDSAFLSNFKERHYPSMNLFYRLHDIWGNDVIRPKRVDDLYRAFTGTPSISATNLVDLYGVKYVVSITPLEEDSRFELIYARLEGLEGKREDLLKENTVKLYRRRDPFPRAWLVGNFRILNSHEILSRMVGEDFHPGEEVFLEEEPKWEKQSLGKVQAGEVLRHALPNQVEILSEGNNRLRLLVKARVDALLVLSDTHFPGWKAFVDGKRSKIYRADYTFRAIPVVAGTHEVEFAYDPWSFKLGAGISFLGAVGCVIIGWTVRRKKARHRVSVLSREDSQPGPI